MKKERIHNKNQFHKLAKLIVSHNIAVKTKENKQKATVSLETRKPKVIFQEVKVVRYNQITRK